MPPIRRFVGKVKKTISITYISYGYIASFYYKTFKIFLNSVIDSKMQLKLFTKRYTLCKMQLKLFKDVAYIYFWKYLNEQNVWYSALKNLVGTHQ